MTSVQLFGWAISVLLVSVRVAVLFLSTPVFGSIPVPNVARVILVFSISVGLVAGMPVAIEIPGIASLAASVLKELVVGSSIAIGLFAGFGAFQFGGRLLDFQIGYGMSSVIDTATRNNAPLLGSLLSMLGILVFFLIDGHLIILHILKLSLIRIPPGGGFASLGFDVVIAQFASCFVFGLAIVAPVVLCLLVVDIGVAFMSRTMPQMNVFLMAFGLKVFVGLTVLAITVPLLAGVLQRVFESIFRGSARALGLNG